MSILQSTPTSIKSLEKKATKKKTKKLIRELDDLQSILLAQEKFSLLIVLQGLDASGKDGTIRNVFGALSPMGIRVFSFKKPTPLEMNHDFLWRVHQNVPDRGMIHVFNRSHYEDILVPSVEGYLPSERVAKRYDRINAFEDQLLDNDTHILKFYLHVSKDEQFRRLTERTTDVTKYWKHNDGDWKTREKFDKYQEVYERIFDQCSKVSPWHIIPADENYIKEYKIAELVVEKLKSLSLEWPPLETELFKK
uniref:PPK2 family polyphosphate kinase n=1 Tax=Fulvivirga sp. TaxID=1931237 RepID=UPI00404930BC